ncbi:hypothetical protein LLOABG_LLOABG_06025, partial [Dysosmobacter welbionis]
ALRRQSDADEPLCRRHRPDHSGRGRESGHHRRRQSRQVHSRLEGKGHQGDARSGGGGSGQAAGSL